MKFLEQTSKTSSILIVKSFVEKRTAGWMKTASRLPSLCHLRSNKSVDGVKIWEDVKVTAPAPFTETTFNAAVPGLERYEKCGDCIGTGNNKCNDCKGRGFKECKKYDEKLGNTEKCVCGNEKCKNGVKPCSTCGKEGLTSCKTCNSFGFVKFYYNIKIEFKTIKQVYAHDSFSLLPFSCLENAEGTESDKMSTIGVGTPTLELNADDKIKDMSISFIKNQRQIITTNNYRSISEELEVKLVPVTEILYKWKKHRDFLFVYGVQDSAYFNEYPITCCFC